MRIPLSVPLTFSEIFKNSPSIIKIKRDATVGFISTNSKEVEEGDLFIAIKGERLDGEKFSEEAKNKGAYLLSSIECYADLLANDTTAALLEIASYFKSKLNNLKYTVAITGSVGKTTTKNVMAKMLSTKYITHATEENFNNYIGISYTILSAPKNTEIIIAELGMNHLGEISLMSKTLKPDISVITNIGTSHIGNLGSRELIASAKLEIIDGMENPCLIVPHDEPLLEECKRKKYTFSINNPKSDYYIQITEAAPLFSSFNVISKTIRLNDLKIDFPGKHVIDAIGISIAAMNVIGAGEDEIKKAISAIDEKCFRGKLIKIDDFYAYDDTYSSSYEAALCDFEILNLKYKTAKKSCVLGDMLELGEHSDSLHKKLGQAVFRYGFRKLYAIGTHALSIAAGAREAGMDEENIFINPDAHNIEITAKQILENKISDEIILFKASHDIHAEKIIELLLNIT